MTLTVNGLRARYGSSQVLFGIDFSIGEGQVVTLLGRNGMGKTTTVKALTGMLRQREGKLNFDGKDIGAMESHAIARLGIGLVPEGRRIFTTLSVKENLIATAGNSRRVRDPWTIDKIVALFPNLGRRLKNQGWQLSGGEQQMLAIGRALMTNPKLLILDEATEGLAPLVREEIWQCLSTLKSMGQSILLIDKNMDKVARIADRHIVLEKGRVVWEGDSASLLADKSIAAAYLGV